MGENKDWEITVEVIGDSFGGKMLPEKSANMIQEVIKGLTGMGVPYFLIGVINPHTQTIEFAAIETEGDDISLAHYMAKANLIRSKH